MQEDDDDLELAEAHGELELDADLFYARKGGSRFLHWDSVRTYLPVLAILVAAAAGSFFLLSGASGPLRIHGRGPAVVDLAVNSRVVIGHEEVGVVTIDTA